MRPIDGCWWHGFGDLWANCSRVARTPRNEDVLFSAYAGKDTRRARPRAALTRAIFASLGADTSRIEVVPGAMNTGHRFGVREHRESYVPTRVRWQGAGSRIVTYQLETHTRHRPERRMPTAEIDAFLRWCGANGWTPVDLYLPGAPHASARTLSECIAHLAASAFFVGIDSGASHIAHSVGVPTFLYGWAELDAAHAGKVYTAFRRWEDVVRVGAARRWDLSPRPYATSPASGAGSPAGRASRPAPSPTEG